VFAPVASRSCPSDYIRDRRRCPHVATRRRSPGPPLPVWVCSRTLPEGDRDGIPLVAAPGAPDEVQGSRFRVHGSWFTSSGFKGSQFTVHGSRVPGSPFTVQGSGLPPAPLFEPSAPRGESREPAPSAGICSAAMGAPSVLSLAIGLVLLSGVCWTLERWRAGRAGVRRRAVDTRVVRPGPTIAASRQTWASGPRSASDV
jgi:hypothetical protein